MNKIELVMGNLGMIADGVVGLKLATVREFKPGKYEGIEKGAEFDAVDHDREYRIPSRCLEARKGENVTSYDPALLMLDGFINPQTAAEGLAEFYPGFNETTPSALFVYAAESLIDRLFPKQQQKNQLLSGDIREVVRRPENAKLFNPSWAYWFFYQYGSTIDKWYEWMNSVDLLSPERKDFITNWKKNNSDEYSLLSTPGKAMLTLSNFFEKNRKLSPTFERAILLREPASK